MKLSKLFKLFLVNLLILSGLILFSNRVMAYNMGYHYDLIREAMIKEGFDWDAYSIALAANSYVDIFQEESTEYLIDDTFCEKSKVLVVFAF